MATQRSALVVLATLLPAAGLQAQIHNLATVQDGNLAYTQQAIGTSTVQTWEGDLRCDGVAGQDHLYQHGWYYLVEGDARARPLRNDGTASRMQNGTRLEVTWADVEGRGLLRAELVIDVFRTGPTAGAVVARLTMINRTAMPLRVSVFHYADVDVCGSGLDSATGSGSEHVITDPCGTVVRHRAVQPDRSDIGGYNGQNLGLASGAGIVDLANRLPPFGSGDYTGAFQWRLRTLPPGERATFTGWLTCNEPLTRPPLVEHYGPGAGGTFGGPAIEAIGPPLVDPAASRAFAVQMRHGAPWSLAAVLANLAPARVPFYALTMLVDPNGLVTLFHVSDGNGDATQYFALPPNPALAGLALYAQWLVLDVNGPGGVASHTAAVRLQVGVK